MPVRSLRHLLDKYGDEKDALAAYNAGQRNVDEWRAEGKGIRPRSAMRHRSRPLETSSKEPSRN